MVADRGYGAASLAAVAEQAGISKGLVSHYFTSRDALMEAAALHALVDLRNAVSDGVDTCAPVPQILEAAIHRAARLLSTHAGEMTAIGHIVLNLRNQDGTLRLGADAYEDVYRDQEELFRRGQREGSLRTFDTLVMAITYQSSIDAMLNHLAAHPEADPDRYADELTSTVLAAVRA